MIPNASLSNAKFIRRTELKPDEYRANFRQIDCDVIVALSSSEARHVTPLMSHIYLQLLNAPSSYWERDGILRFVSEVREDEMLTAWQLLREISGVANSTLSKALNWMHQTGLIGYSSGRNGVGIRIFINRAASSIRSRHPEKNLRLIPTPTSPTLTPSDGTPFKESYSERNLEADKNPVAPARDTGKAAPSIELAIPAQTLATIPATRRSHNPATGTDSVDEIVRRIKQELSETLTTVCSREVARTRDWLEKAGLPKAVRVAQHETYQVLRSLGIVEKTSKADHKAKARVGLASPQSDLSREEVIKLWVDLAATVRGTSLDEMLTEYVTRGDMTGEEARAILREAGMMGLWKEA
jgi:hypothetical protein